MKKLLLLVCAITFAAGMFAQDGKVHKVMVEPVFQKDNLFYVTDSLEVNFYYFGSLGELNVQVKNKTKDRLYIEWENARFADSRIVFGDDSRLSMRNPKADEMVSSNSTSIHRRIIPERWVKSDYIINLIEESDIREEGGYECEIIIPIRYGEGKTVDYKFLIHIYYLNPVDCSGIEVGMKGKDVKKLIGAPDSIFKLFGVQTWYYASNVTLEVEGGVVTKITDMKKPYMFE